MLEQYKNWLIVNGQSKSTVKDYVQRARDFLKEVNLENINEENIIQYLLKLQETKSVSTVNGYKSAFKSFLKYIKKDIAVPKHSKTEQKLPESIDEEFFENKVIPIVEALFNNPFKMKAVLYFMFYTGIRVSEIDTLRRENIDLTNRQIKIYVKKKKEERIVFLSKKVRDILQVYFELEPEIKNAFNISSASVQKAFDSLKPNFKEVNLHAHLFRHSFAIMALKKGAGIDDVMRWLGHSSINSTMRYTRLNTTLSQEKYNNIFK